MTPQEWLDTDEGIRWHHQHISPRSGLYSLKDDYQHEQQMSSAAWHWLPDFAACVFFLEAVGYTGLADIDGTGHP